MVKTPQLDHTAKNSENPTTFMRRHCKECSESEDVDYRETFVALRELQSFYEMKAPNVRSFSVLSQSDLRRVLDHKGAPLYPSSCLYANTCDTNGIKLSS